MSKWLSDAELDAIARTFADECDVEKLLAQAGEANRLRAGLETVITQLAGSIVHSIPVCQPELESYNRKLRELLEGGE